MGVKFNLLNHTKPDSLFNYGMQVLVFSEEESRITGKGWHREGKDISYYQNSFKRVNYKWLKVLGVNWEEHVLLFPEFYL